MTCDYSSDQKRNQLTLDLSFSWIFRDHCINYGATLQIRPGQDRPYWKR